MVTKLLELKRLLLISLVALLVFSCNTNKKQTGEFPETIEMEMSTDGNEFFEVKHKSAEQAKVDSIKNLQNNIKKGKK